MVFNIPEMEPLVTFITFLKCRMDLYHEVISKQKKYKSVTVAINVNYCALNSRLRLLQLMSYNNRL